MMTQFGLDGGKVKYWKGRDGTLQIDKIDLRQSICPQWETEKVEMASGRVV